MTSNEQPPVSAGVKRALTHFARNGRWGTCVECPRDGDGNQLPELCPETNRGDHWLKLSDIVESHNFDVRSRRFEA